VVVGRKNQIENGNGDLIKKLYLIYGDKTVKPDAFGRRMATGAEVERQIRRDMKSYGDVEVTEDVLREKGDGPVMMEVRKGVYELVYPNDEGLPVNGKKKKGRNG